MRLLRLCSDLWVKTRFDRFDIFGGERYTIHGEPVSAPQMTIRNVAMALGFTSHAEVAQHALLSTLTYHLRACSWACRVSHSR